MKFLRDVDEWAESHSAEFLALVVLFAAYLAPFLMLGAVALLLFFA